MMAGPDEMSDVQPTGVKRPLLDVESLQRKKFKTEELPLTAAQHTAIEDLLHAFKKKGGFDNVRKKIWAEFHDGVCFRLIEIIGTLSNCPIYPVGSKNRVYEVID
jgi:hypothetical protein